VRPFLVLIVVTALAAPAARAQEETWPPGSAMHTGALEVKRRDAALTVLEGLHSKVVRLLRDVKSEGGPDTRLIAAIEAHQAAWVRYISDECEVIGSLTGASGSWPSTHAISCEANLAESRVRRTRAAIRCIERVRPDRRRFEANNCLYQLAPIAVPLR